MFATGVTVVTTLKGEQVHGMTANAFMSVSLEPPLVLVSIDRRTRMCGLLHVGGHYGVSVLCETQSALSDRFAGRAAETACAEPRFDVVRETPLVDGALAHFVALRRALLLGRRPLALPRPRRVRAPALRRAAALPRRTLRQDSWRRGSTGMSSGPPCRTTTVRLRAALPPRPRPRLTRRPRSLGRPPTSPMCRASSACIGHQIRAATESQGARMEEMREAIADVTRGARDAGGSCC